MQNHTSFPKRNWFFLRSAMLQALVTSALALALESCADESADLKPRTNNPQQLYQTLGAKDADRPLRHPLLNLERADRIQGNTAGMDVNSPNAGERYVVSDTDGRSEYGQSLRFSGVVRNARAPISTAEWREMLRRKKVKPSHHTHRNVSVVTPELQQRLTETTEDTSLSVLVRYRVPLDLERVADGIERGIRSGLVRTVAQRDELRRRIVESRRTALDPLGRAVERHIASLGGKVTGRGLHIPGIAARMTPKTIARLSTSALISRIDINGALEEKLDLVGGNAVINGTQSRLFHDYGHQGRLSWTERGSIIEFSPPFREHPGFGFGNEPNNIYPTRFEFGYDCSTDPCSSMIGYSNPGSHATMVAGIMLGSLLDGQDPVFTDPWERRERTGSAPEALASSVVASGDDSGMIRAIDRIAGLSYQINVANASLGPPSMDFGKCNGNTPVSSAVNDLFESGTLLVVAAGNDGHSGECNMGDLQSAAGAFTVGGHTNSPFSDSPEWDVRYGDIWTGSSLGGTSWWDGRHRTIIDITAPACHGRGYDLTGGYSRAECGTSLAAPVVSGGALSFIDFYKATYSHLIDNPGVLFANLLLMGDRESATGRLDTRFSNLWGAGRFKARMWDAYGMDSPWQWGTGYTCVDDSENVYITLNNGNRISRDVDALKAVIWWFDRRSESNEYIDDIDLSLQRYTSSYWQTIKDSNHGYDNKERVYHDSFDAYAYWRLRISGFDVTSSDAGCGNNSMRVYYAYMFEDSDRDDWNGPSSQMVDPE